MGILMPVQLSNISSHNNSIGLQLESTSSEINIREVVASLNEEYGIFLNQAEGYNTISDLKAKDNKMSGIHFIHTRPCNQFSVAYRYSTTVTVTQSEFSGNSETSFSITTSCRVAISAVNNTITGSKSGIIARLDYNAGSEMSNLVIQNNSFYSLSSDAIKMNGTSSATANINNNTFTYVSYCSVNLAFAGRSSRSHLVYLQSNIFQQIQSFVSVIYINIPRYGQDPREYNIKDNRFMDIHIEGSLIYHLYSLNYAYTSAVVYLKTAAQVQMNYNFFNNITSLTKLFVADEGTLVHDVTRNYWDNKEINSVSKSIYAYHQNALLAVATYVPFLLSANRTNTSSDTIQYPDFIQDMNIGGILNTKAILVQTSEPYQVTQDIIVLPNASLEINAGVSLMFEYGVGMVVFGHLAVKGESGENVIFDAKRGTSRYVRLVDGQTALEGFVQIYYNNTWHILCYSRLSADTLDLLCAEARGASHEGGNKYQRGNYPAEKKIKTLQCGSTFQFCDMGDVTEQCSSDYYQYLSCKDRYWSGIHLAVDAKKSTLKHLTINGYGETTKTSRSGLLIEFHHHNISDIKLLNHSSAANDVTGITILRNDGVANPSLSNLEMIKSNGHGILAYNTRFEVLDSNFSSTSPEYSALYLKEEMSALPSLREEITQPVCFTREYFLKADEVKFLHVDDTVLTQNTNCSIYITTEQDHIITVQVIRGTIPDCGPGTLQFYDGHLNNSVATSVGPDNNGMVWTSTGNSTHILMKRHYHWLYRCLDITLRIWACQGKITYV